MHANFKSAGLKPGLEIWRIENFEPVPYPTKDYGKFFTGDSYIILSTVETKSGQIHWDVHFWLGRETTQDEAGSAAIYTVQLDEQLGGVPIQHREVQDYESKLFLNYFKHGIRYMPGGHASGFKHIITNEDDTYKRFFQVKGKTHIRVREVALSVASMNRGDCFILDTGEIIYVYIGKKSKRLERMKAINAANQIRDQDHHGRSAVLIVDEFSTLAEQEKFFEVLGSGSPYNVPDESTGGDDEAFEKKEERRTTLYHICDASGELKVTKVSHKPLKQEMLNTNDAYILDTGNSLYVWVGRKSTDQEKSKALSKAQGFLVSKKYPSWTKVTRIVEGAETAPFKQYFSAWRDYGSDYARLLLSGNEELSKEEFDVSLLHKLGKAGGTALSFMPDNGDGEVEVWRVFKNNLVDVPKEHYGNFFGDDAYVVKYKTVNDHGFVIYYWQGSRSSSDDKTASAVLAMKKNKELGKKAIMVRVVEGFEPRHLLKIFKGKLVVYSGPKVEGVKESRLFRIRGTFHGDIRATQIPETASSLASDDAFILETPKTTYIWVGKGASEFERSTAQSVAKTLSPDRTATVINEGSEPVEFWSALGGKQSYDNEIDPPGAPILEPRLFHCKINSYGKFKVEEIVNFEQSDLDIEDIMVLDRGDEVYVWIGRGSTKEEKSKSTDMVKQYLKGDPTHRSEDTTPIIHVTQGHEPPSFKNIFPAWIDQLWDNAETYEEFRKKVVEGNKNIKFN